MTPILKHGARFAEDREVRKIIDDAVAPILALAPDVMFRWWSNLTVRNARARAVSNDISGDPRGDTSMFYKRQGSNRKPSRSVLGSFGYLTKAGREYSLARLTDAPNRALSVIGSIAVAYAMLTPMATAQPSCADWGTFEFFAVASVDDVV